MRDPLKRQENLFYLISPSKPVVKFVESMKAHVKNTLGHRVESRLSKPHLSLMKDSDKRAERFLYDVESKLCSFKPFDVSVKNLNVFVQSNHKRTIYLDVVYKTPICEIFETLTEKNIDFTPHITIAKNLENDDFMKVWRDLRHVSYSNNFRCDHITVLKKTERKWIHYADIPFNG